MNRIDNKNKTICQNTTNNIFNGFKCKIVLSSSSKESIDKYINLISKTINQSFIKVIWLPKKKSRIALLKSPHVNKRAKEHFEINNYKANVIILSNSQFEQRYLMFLKKPAFVQIKTIWSVFNK